MSSARHSDGQDLDGKGLNGKDLAGKDLDGKVVLITGASRGIGQATALRCAAAGARLFRMDVNPAPGEEGPAFLRGDVAVEADREAFVRAAEAHCGRIDVLINNAASSAHGSVLKVPLGEWRRVLETNLTAPMHLSALAAPIIARSGGGAIVNVASVQGLLAEQDNAAYNASKAGLINLTRSMALDLAPHGIRVNAVAPGAIATERLLAAIAAMPDPEHTRRDWEDLHALRRLGAPAEVAEAVCFLASPRAGFISGAILTVDGAMTASFMMAGRPV